MSEAQKLLEEFRAMGMTDNHLAEKLGVTRETICRIRRGKNNCTGETILSGLRMLKQSFQFKQQVQSPKQQVQPPKQQVQPPKQQVQPPKQQVQPPKQQVQPPKQTLSIIKVTNERVTLANASRISMKWTQTHNICCACQNKLGNTSSYGYLGETFVVLCDHCLMSHSHMLKPCPKN